MDHSDDTTLTPLQNKERLDLSSEKTHTPMQNRQRLGRLRLAEWAGQFAAWLKAGVLWIRQLLPGSK